MQKGQFALVCAAMCFLLAACGSSTGLDDKQKVKGNQQDVICEYPYANSTDIYSAESDLFLGTRYYQCKLDGTDKREISLGESESGYGYSILSVSDTYLYFYEYDEDEKVRIWRVSLKKGDDGRSLISGKPESVADWQALESNFAVADDYFLKIGNRISLVKNINTGKEDKRELPEILMTANGKKKKSEWFVLGKGKGWVLWGGDALMLQMVSSNQCIVLETGSTSQAAVSVKADRIYYTARDKAGVSCWMYDVGTGEKKQIAEQKSIEESLYKGLAISKKKMRSYKFDRIMCYENKCYVQFIVTYYVKGKVRKRYYMLSVDADLKGKIDEEIKLNQILSDHAHIQKGMGEKEENQTDRSRYVGYVGDFLYLRAESNYCYNMKTRELKEMGEKDPEYNMYFAISKVRAGEK